jgi:hypothetical protein
MVRVAAAVFAGGFVAQSASITVTNSPNSGMVLEGVSGVFNWTVTNILAQDNVTITSVNQGPITLTFRSDAEDEVYRAAIVTKNDFCTNFTIGPGGTCKFQETFDTRDLSSVPDKDIGTWAVEVDVVFTVNGVQSTEKAGGIADVADPGVPEPASYLLSIIGLGAVAAYCGFRETSTTV